MRYVINYAHQRGVKVSGHLEATSWGDAIEMGIDVLHHGIYAMHEIMPEGIPKALGEARLRDLMTFLLVAPSAEKRASP